MARPPSQATGRQRRDGSRPSGNSSGRKIHVSPKKHRQRREQQGSGDLSQRRRQPGARAGQAHTPENLGLTQKTWTAGQSITVLDAAKLMISISDNTATDLLLAKAGRENVEAVNHRWSPNADRNTPFLSTRELFTLKHVRYPELTDKYLALDTAGRRAFLADVVDPTPTSAITVTQKPVELDRIEWFASRPTSAPPTPRCVP